MADRLAPNGASVDAGPDDPAHWRSLDYVHDQVTEKLKQQYEVLSVVDGRLRLILGVIGVVFAAALGLQRATTQIPFWVGALAISAIVLFLAAGILVARYFPSTDFEWPPDPETLSREYLPADPRVAKFDVVDACIRAWIRNNDILSKKTRAFNVAFVLTAVATALMGFAVLAQVACQTVVAPWGFWYGNGC